MFLLFFLGDIVYLFEYSLKGLLISDGLDGFGELISALVFFISFSVKDKKSLHKYFSIDSNLAFSFIEISNPSLPSLTKYISSIIPSSFNNISFFKATTSPKFITTLRIKFEFEIPLKNPKLFIYLLYIDIINSFLTV